MPGPDDPNVKPTFIYDTKDCPADQELRRYCKGVLPPDRQAQVEYHLSFCEQCNAFVTLSEESEVPKTVPLPKELMEKINVVARQIWSDRQLQSANLLEAGPEVAPSQVGNTGEDNRLIETPKWSSQLERALQSVVEFGKNYGAGTLIGTLRVLGGGPALATRGQTPVARVVTVIEVPVKSNIYGIGLTSSDDGLVLEIAGYKTTDLLPAKVAMISLRGIELVSRDTDIYGNAQIIVPHHHLSDERYVIDVALGNDDWEAFTIEFHNRKETSS